MPISPPKIRREDDSGIRIESPLGNQVPWYEEHEARIQAGYTVTEWYALHWGERALEIAHYRVRWYVEAHKAEEAKIRQKREQAKMRRR